MFKYVLVSLLMLSGAANAHAQKEGTVPAADATVAEVPLIAMTFDDPMLITTISLTGPDGAISLTRETDMVAAKGFKAVPDDPLSNGTYQVDWRGLASDGHPMQGTFRFSVNAAN